MLDRDSVVTIQTTAGSKAGNNALCQGDGQLARLVHLKHGPGTPIGPNFRKSALTERNACARVRTKPVGKEAIPWEIALQK